MKMSTTEAGVGGDRRGIFGFEMDFAGTLRCIPMIVRFKLDQCGVKLSLRQWCRFTRDERAFLVDTPCYSADAARAYRDELVRLIEARGGEKAVEVPIDPNPPWSQGSRVPGRLVAWAEGLGVLAPTAEQWERLTPLQRFALFKLTRPAHDNDNFLPAMREFGLLE